MSEGKKAGENEKQKKNEQSKHTVVSGLTPKQRDWIVKGRDDERCLLIKSDRQRCYSRRQPQGHHIRPRGWFLLRWREVQPDMHVNGPHNIATLCAYHHVGKGATPAESLTLEGVTKLLRVYAQEKDPAKIRRALSRLEFLFPECVHPDMAAIYHYRKMGGKYGFTHCMRAVARGRRILCPAGIVYWNSNWDAELLKLAARQTASYTRRDAPPYPDSKRGFNGMLPEDRPDDPEDDLDKMMGSFYEEAGITIENWRARTRRTIGKILHR